MGLIKKGTNEDVKTTSYAPKSAIMRSGTDFQAIEAMETPPPPPPRPEQPFQEGLAKKTSPDMTGGKLLGGKAAPVAPSRPLPKIPTVTVMDGKTQMADAAPSVPSAPEDHGHHPNHPHPTAPAGPPIDQAIIEEAQARAQQILNEAAAAANQMMMEYQMNAQQMMEQANQQIQAAAEQVQRQAQEQGFQQGYQEGMAAGSQAAQQQLTQLVIQARDLYVQAIKQRHLLLATAEPELARLSIKVAEKIIGCEIKSNPEAIVGIVKSALAGVGDREEVTIRVHPDDYEMAAQHRPIFERMVEGLKKFDVMADASIDQGGCSIETNLGNVDARLKTQLTAIRQAMHDHAESHDREIREEVAAMQVEAPPE